MFAENRHFLLFDTKDADKSEVVIDSLIKNCIECDINIITISNNIDLVTNRTNLSAINM